MRIISAGAPIRIDSMHFSVDDPSVYYEEAREKAVVDTKVKADHLAELGGLLLVSQLTSLRVSIYFACLRRRIWICRRSTDTSSSSPTAINQPWRDEDNAYRSSCLWYFRVS